MAEASRSIRMDALLGHTLMVFCCFITLFGFMEFRRVLGEETFYSLLFSSERPLTVPPITSEITEQEGP